MPRDHLLSRMMANPAPLSAFTVAAMGSSPAAAEREATA